MRYRDEEPDVDEVEYDISHEDNLVWKYCERCGHEGHKGVDCPNVQPWMLKDSTKPKNQLHHGEPRKKK